MQLPVDNNNKTNSDLASVNSELLVAWTAEGKRTTVL